MQGRRILVTGAGKGIGRATVALLAARGADAAWLAFSREDENVGVLMLDGSGTSGPWFARSEEYAGMCPAPFFHHSVPLAPGDRMFLSAIVLIGDAEVARFADTVGTELVAELTAAAPAATNF